MKDILKKYFEEKKYKVVLKYGKRSLVCGNEYLSISKANLNKIKEDTNVDTGFISDWIYDQELDPVPEKTKPPKISKSDEIQIDLEEIGIEPRFNGYTGLYEWLLNTVPLNMSQVIHEIWMHRDKHGKEQFATKDTQLCLETHIERRHREMVLNLRDAIKYQPNLPDLFEKLVRHICVDKYDKWYKVILYQTVWTIKRRVFDLPDYCPIITNIYGNGGCGKSEFIEYMFSVIPSGLRDNVGDASAVFNKDENGFRFVDFYLMYLGEMSGLDQATLEKVKNSVDLRVKMYRLFFTQKLHSARNVATMVGTSNRHLKNILVADADARKWAEIEFWEYKDSEIPEKMVNPLKTFDWLTLWRSVNENGPSPFEDAVCYQAFRRWNTPKITTFTPTVEFIINLIKTRSNQLIPRKDLYSLYSETVTNNTQGKARFFELVEKYGFHLHKRNGEHYYLVSDPKTCIYIEEEKPDDETTIHRNPPDEEDPNWSDNIKL